MEDRLLFVNKYETIIAEFLEAMSDVEFQIDVAGSGLDAVEMIKKNKYKIVITGMSLPAENGMKLLTYINEYHPQIICIVYTIRMDLAHLNFLINERNVFRIFLRPANYKEEFYQSILDGFSYFDLMENDAGPIDKINKGNNEDAAKDREKEQNIERFLSPLLKMFVRDSFEYLNTSEQKMVVQFENDILDYYVRREYIKYQGFQEIKADIEKEFIKAEEISITYMNEEEKSSCADWKFDRVHFILWLILYRYTLLGDNLKCKIEIMLKVRGIIEINVDICLPNEVWKAHDSLNGARTITDLTRFTIKNFVIDYKEGKSEDVFIYRVGL